MLLEKKAYPKGCPFSCPFYGEKIEYDKIYCQNAENIAGKVLGLPNHIELEKEDLERIIEIIHDIKVNKN